MSIEPTPEQRQIIDFPFRPLRVAAGAGTGKTITMALRLAHLVSSGQVQPEHALGITFTNKAAGELADRLRSELPHLAREGREVEVTTYHGFAHGILREFGAMVGIERQAPVVTAGYARQLMRDALGQGSYAALDLTAASRRVNELSTLAGQLADHLLAPEDLIAAAPTPEDQDEAWRQRLEMAAALMTYQGLKRRLSAVDYGDLIRLAYRLLEAHPEVADQIRSRYQAVLLDEYQDTNPAQRELLLRLFYGGFPVTAVGDADQTIYEWRGASLQNFADFPQHFRTKKGSPATTLYLSANHRSDRLILDLANHIRQQIPDELGIERLRATEAAGDGLVATGWFRTSAEEAGWIASEVRRLHDDNGFLWRDIGVLFRKNRQIAAVRNALAVEGIPVDVAALGGLLDVPEVADLHAWLRILGRPDDAPALMRILLGSHFRLGLGDLAPLARWIGRHRHADDDGRSLGWAMIEAVDRLDECDDLSAEAQQRLTEFRDLYRELLQKAQGITLVELCRRILDQTGAWPEVEALDDAARLSARLNLYRFLDLAEEWSPLEGRPSLDAFLEYLELLSEEETVEELDTARLGEGDAVALLTVHRAKGLEWPVVFLPALCKGTFPAGAVRLEDPLRFADLLPYQQRLDVEYLPGLSEDDDERRDLLRQRHRAQEWRTAYVAVTRARRRLLCTGAFWYTANQAKEKSPLFELVESLPGSISFEAAEDPGGPPEGPRVDDRAARPPDPHFSDGWQAALRKAIVDPGWPERLAEESGNLPAYHAQMDQLRITLDGLGEPSPPEAEDAGLRTSVTGLVSYATCPRRFYWSEVDRLPRRPSPELERGIELHRKIELYNRGAVPLEEADHAFYDVAPAEAVDEEPRDAFAAFKASRFAAERPIVIEAPFALKVGDARVGGRIDAIYEADPGHWEVVDFKSGRPKDDPAARVQLQAYGLAVRQVGFVADPPDRITVTFAYLGDGVTEVSESVDEAWLEDAQTRLGDLVSAATAGEYHATPAPACRTCDFSRFCEPGQTWLQDNG
ncbi:MAG: ATP-dependent DNA helicase [Acidimicrobiia bacterium]